MTDLKLILKKLFLLIVTVALTLVIMELLFLFVIDKQDFFLVRINREYHPYFSLKPFENLEDLETPGTVNSIGLRSKEYSVNKSPGIYRIAMLGDSFTFGYGNSLNETISYLLEDILNSNSNKSFEVINFGIPGFNTGSEYYSYIENAVSFSPNLVILNYFLNDPESCNINNTRLDFFRLIRYLILENTNSFYHNLDDSDKYFYLLHSSFNPCWNSVSKYISMLKKNTSLRNQSLMIVFIGSGPRNDSYMRSLSEKIQLISENNKIAYLSVIDTLSHYPGQISNHKVKLPHYTYFANKLIANETYKKLVQEKLV